MADIMTTLTMRGIRYGRVTHLIGVAMAEAMDGETIMIQVGTILVEMPGDGTGGRHFLLMQQLGLGWDARQEEAHRVMHGTGSDTHPPGIKSSTISLF